MLINPRLHKGLFAVKEATMPYIQSAVHAFGPSYVRHSKQSFIGGTYRTLADESMIDTPSCFDVRHRAELYTHKAPLHAEPAHRSIYIPETEASVAPCDTDILAITDEQHTSSFAAEEQVNGNHALQAMPCTLQTVRTALTTAEHSLKRTGYAIASATRTTAAPHAPLQPRYVTHGIPSRVSKPSSSSSSSSGVRMPCGRSAIVFLFLSMQSFL